MGRSQRFRDWVRISGQRPAPSDVWVGGFAGSRGTAPKRFCSQVYNARGWQSCRGDHSATTMVRSLGTRGI